MPDLTPEFEKIQKMSLWTDRGDPEIANLAVDGQLREHFPAYLPGLHNL